jgi:hypothetical protein
MFVCASIRDQAHSDCKVFAPCPHPHIPSAFIPLQFLNLRSSCRSSVPLSFVVSSTEGRPDVLAPRQASGVESNYFYKRAVWNQTISDTFKLLLNLSARMFSPPSRGLARAAYYRLNVGRHFRRPFYKHIRNNFLLKSF